MNVRESKHSMDRVPAVRAPIAAVGPVRVALAIACIVALGGHTAHAHLSLIRQGPESAGVMEEGDRMGEALAVGDFDGDGRDDVAMGAPREDYAGFINVGAVVLSFGSRHGITHEGSTVLTPSILGFPNSDAIEFGSAVAAGDFDADGLDDLAIGAPDDASAGGPQGGRVYVLDRGSGQAAIYSVADFDVGSAPTPDDRFGFSLATGDFDDDGHDDLAIGSNGDQGFRGSVSIIYGSPSGLNPFRTQFLTQSGMGWSEAPGDEFGYALATGNVVGSEHDDLVIGAPKKSQGIIEAGAIYIVAGGDDGLDPQFLSLRYNALDFPGGIQESAHFGTALAVGSFWPGNYMSVAVGEPDRTVSGESQAGRVVAAPGGAFFLTLASALELDQGTGGANPETHDLFGSALAAGDYDSDGLDDLAVGSPGEAIDDDEGDGFAQIFLGSESGPAGAGHPQLPTRFSQVNLGDRPVLFDTWGDELGSALAFGRFDFYAPWRANLAIGAPGNTARVNPTYLGETVWQAGTVFIIAPWRQLWNPSSDTAIVKNCDDQIVYSQRPFDPVLLASTTKVMTALLAAERTEPAHPDYIPWDTEYIVPPFLSGNMFRSGYELETGDDINFQDLIRVCIWTSSRQASVALADMVSFPANGSCFWTGNWPTVCEEFNAMMNDRAAELGMSSSTVFTSAPGRPYPDPPGGSMSTAADMMILARAALAQPRLRSIVGSSGGTITREGQQELVGNGYVTNLKKRLVETSGIKPGSNTPAGLTGVFSAAHENGDVIAGHFSVSKQPMVFVDEDGTAIPQGGATQMYDEAGLLLSLGLSSCAGVPVIPLLPGPYPPTAMVFVPNIPTNVGETTAGTAGDYGEQPDTLLAEIYRYPGTEPFASVDLVLRYNASAVLEPGESVSLGRQPFTAHRGFSLTNDGEEVVELLVTTTGSTGELVTLPPFESHAIDPHTGGAGGEYWLTVQNMATAVTARIGISAGGYETTVTMGDGSAAPDFFSSALFRQGPREKENVWAQVIGRDPATTSEEVFLIVRGADVPEPTGVNDADPALATTGAVRMVRPAAPNPFRVSTQVDFELARESRVFLTIYDAAGRMVRRLGEEGALPAGPGRLVWDGRDGAGRRLPAGVYFYRLEVDNAPAGGDKLLILR